MQWRRESTNGAGITGLPHAKHNKYRHKPYTFTKINSRWINKTQNIKLCNFLKITQEQI